MLHNRGVTFINACPSGGVESLRMLGTHIAAINTPAVTGDAVVDLRGARLIAGLINAHDHLQLNTLPPVEPPRRYNRAYEWILEVDRRRHTDRAFAALVAVHRNDRLLVGGIKNLLSGVTTVAHHDPMYPYLSDPGFPTRVVADFGWSHSLYIDGGAKVRDSYTRTPSDRPWVIHAAEGSDAESACEFDELESLGCVGANTLIVHGVALDAERQARLERAGAGLIWCPSSNMRLLGMTAVIRRLERVAIGTDSRLSGARDILQELRVARDCSGLSDSLLESMVTWRAAQLLRLADRGALQPGLLADLVVVPAGRPLAEIERTDIRLVVIGGMARYADEALAAVMGPSGFWTGIRVDGRPRMLQRTLAATLQAAACHEPGLHINDSTWRAA